MPRTDRKKWLGNFQGELETFRGLINAHWGDRPAVVFYMTTGQVFDFDSNTFTGYPATLSVEVKTSNEEDDAPEPEAEILVCDNSGDWQDYNNEIFNPSMTPVERYYTVAINLNKFDRDTVVSAKGEGTTGDVSGYVFNGHVEYALAAWQSYLEQQAKGELEDGVEVETDPEKYWNLSYTGGPAQTNTYGPKNTNFLGYGFAPKNYKTQWSLFRDPNNWEGSSEERALYAVWSGGTAGSGITSGRSPHGHAAYLLGIPGWGAYTEPVVWTYGFVIREPGENTKCPPTHVEGFSGVPGLPELPEGWYVIASPAAEKVAEPVPDILSIGSTYAWGQYNAHGAASPAILYSLQVVEGTGPIEWEPRIGVSDLSYYSFGGELASGPETYKVQFHQTWVATIPFSDTLPTSYGGNPLWQIGPGDGTGPVYRVVHTDPVSWEPVGDGHGGQLMVWPPPDPDPGEEVAWSSTVELDNWVREGIATGIVSGLGSSSNEFAFAEYWDIDSNQKGVPDENGPTAWTWKGNNRVAAPGPVFPDGTENWAPPLKYGEELQGPIRWWLNNEGDLPGNVMV